METFWNPFWEAFGAPGGVWEVIWEPFGGLWEVFGWKKEKDSFSGKSSSRVGESSIFEASDDRSHTTTI